MHATEHGWLDFYAEYKVYKQNIMEINENIELEQEIEKRER